MYYLNTTKLVVIVWKKTSKFLAIANVLFNGLNVVASSSYVNDIVWEEKKKDVMKYPSLTPPFLFGVIFSTVYANFGFYMVLYATYNANISAKLLTICSIISIIFIIISQIASAFSLLYNNGKEEMWGFLKIVGIVSLGLFIIFACVFAPFIKDTIEIKKRKEEARRHIQSTEKVLHNHGG